ncbi:MAG: hypothetical protein CSA83_00465 [Actinomycetales bacterium]|nr:MAG: hypothetical protein CSA83_00465 [Actinomycetales bacterium]
MVSRIVHRVEIHPLGSADDCQYTVVFTFRANQLLLSRHKDRTTWETQGGHVDPDENVDQGARRELYEESGVIPETLKPICDYWASRNNLGAWGRVYLATVAHIDDLPESEIAEIKWFAKLPKNLTYPGITPVLYQTVLKQLPENLDLI